jgi:HK97 gp10 family phage protein
VSGLVEFKLSGLDDLQAQLLELGAELGLKALAQGARKAFKPVLEAAKQNVPIWSGALREAIKLTVKKPKDGDTVLVVGLYIGKATGPDLGELPAPRRWHFIELGTVKYAAHPYLRPALDANASQVLEDLKTEVAAAIERAVKKKARGPR